MKLLKTIALGLFLAASTAGVSSVAFAEDEGRVTFAPSVAIDNVIAKIKETQDAITAGVDSKEIAAMIKEARDLNKEINANDKVDIGRQRANSELRKARGLAKKGELEEASKLLGEAAEKFADLKNHI